MVNDSLSYIAVVCHKTIVNSSVRRGYKHPMLSHQYTKHSDMVELEAYVQGTRMD